MYIQIYTYIKIFIHICPYTKYAYSIYILFTYLMYIYQKVAERLNKANFVLIMKLQPLVIQLRPFGYLIFDGCFGDMMELILSSGALVPPLDPTAHVVSTPGITESERLSHSQRNQARDGTLKSDCRFFEQDAVVTPSLISLLAVDNQSILKTLKR